MRFEGENFLPTEEDQFKTFQIPQETQFKKPYKLEEFIITKDPESKAILSVLCVFISLEEEIAQSGQAVEQFIHLSAPGEGFAYPNIVEDEDGKQSIELDEETIKNYGITEAQVEVYGGAGISSLTIAGRKVEDENDNKIIAPRLIFPFEMKTPQPSEITKASGGEQTFY